MKKIIDILLFFLIVSHFLFSLTHEEIKECYYNSFALESQQKYQLAIDNLFPVVNEYPQGYTINYRLAWLYYLKGNYRNAIRHYKISLKKFPNSLEIWKGLCLVYLKQEDWKDLESTSLKIIKSNYLDQQGNYWYIIALKNQKKNTQLEKLLYKLLYYYPTTTDFLFLLSELNYQNKKYKQAKKGFEDILILNPYHQVVKNYLKKIKIKLSQKKEK